ncbi:MAG TPA: DUF4238 domain-containing protein [Firmicutes bacterium]|uniref:DUF4238 domain-containing protein n=1 Tax=uncultured Subdoligranulum sp. TaxID=512298 RepID=UPI001FA3DEBE|nr:DUF4238 domain-containing protein [uncultured Subdoligranulum sp.]HJB25675.1 DUF4238 domain-containing protein [Bacillota bacterium]
MANAYTDQHITPKRYLDRFGTKGRKATMIGTRMLTKGKVNFFIAATDDVGYIKNYYDVTDKDDPKYWEHFFANKIDTLCGQDLGNIIAKVTLSQWNATILSVSDKEVLSKIIVAQLMRVPESIDYVTGHIYPRVSKQVKKEIAESLPDFMLEKYGELLSATELSTQYQKEFILNHTFDPKNFDRYCKVLQNGIWIVYVNTLRALTPFVTSDNPVLVEGIGKTETGLFANGLASPTTCIFYPLSPAIAVAIYSRDGILGIAADQYDGRKIALDDIKYIVAKNSQIVDQAYLHSFIPQPLYDELTGVHHAGK